MSSTAIQFKKKYLLAANPTTVRGAAVHLGGDPKGESILYTNGRSVLIRNLKNPAICTEYTGHTAAATCARFAPSGFYIASGDVNGNVRVWDTTQETQGLKYEAKIVSGRINDISWDVESKRILAVGDGKDRFGHVFMFDTGSSVGEISGHNKVINACSIRQQRPFRAVTCSDDFTVNFYHGAPYKFNLSISDHTRFVNDVKFSPDGKFFISVGADRKIFMYDGSTGEKIKEIGDESTAHQGGVFSFSWSPKSDKIFTTSADYTCKLWDIESGKVVQNYVFDRTTNSDDQQVGSLWQGEHLVSLSLSGDLNYWSLADSKSIRTVQGHTKAITALASIGDGKTFFTGSYDGRIYAWENAYETGIPVDGAGHSNQVNDLVFNQDSTIYSIGMDDNLKSISVPKKTFNAETLALGSQPKSLLVNPIDQHTSAVLTLEGIKIVKNASESTVFPAKLNFEPTCIAISPKGDEIAIGGNDNKVRIYKNDESATNLATLDANRGIITCISYSPDGSLIAVGDASSKIFVYETSSRQVKLHQWVFHTGRVNSIAWAPDSKSAVSGSLDTNVIVWSVEKPMKKIMIKGAHQESVTNVAFLNASTVVSTGQDACIRIWDLLSS